MKKNYKKIIAMGLLMICTIIHAQATTRYVKTTASGTADGSSWDNASNDLQAMITESSSGDSVFVAAGTYTPATSFAMKEGVKILGGFPATGNPTISDRNWGAHTTELQNTSSVIYNNNNGLTSYALIDGFTIQIWGISYSIDNYNASPTISNCIFKGEKGIINLGFSFSSPLINNCIFLNTKRCILNSSYGYGTVTNCTFYGANYESIYSSGGWLTLKNNIIWNGANGSNFSGESSNNLYGVGLVATDVFLNPSDIDGADNIMGTADDGLTLKPTPDNPAINEGDNAAIGSGVYTDFTGLQRTFPTDGIVDRGAYELQQIVTSTIKYVTPSGSGSRSGKSWTNASNDLQLMINNSNAGDSIFVAAGTYKPIRRADSLNIIDSNNRNNAFVMKAGVKIYGGFAGTESTLAARDIVANLTTLSGDFSGDDVVSGSVAALSYAYNSENAYHVVIAAGDSTSAGTLDGFTIKGGNANGSGGIIVNGRYTSSQLGGGLFISLSSPRIINCFISGNKVAISGGGLYLNSGNSSVIKNNVFSMNRSEYWGGAINIVFGDNDTIANNLIVNNYSTYAGGGIRNYQSQSHIINNTITGNVSNSGSGITNNGDQIQNVSNNIISDNVANISDPSIYNEFGALSAFTYNLVQGGYPGTGNIDANPLFADAAGGNYSLEPCSPAINAGINNSVPTSITKDINGNARIQHSTVDMGAYESPYVTPTIGSGLPSVELGWDGPFTGGTKVVTDFNTCHTIAKVMMGTNNPGYMSVLHFIADTNRTTSGEPFIKRFYEIWVNNQPTTPAYATIYFTDQDISDYNALVTTMDTSVYPLIDSIGSNIKITAYHNAMGSGGGVLGPGSYNPSNTELITPTNVYHDTANGIWQVTFTTTQFSGFFLHTKNANSPLPISISPITAMVDGDANRIDWKVLTEDEGTLYELMTSTDGLKYQSLAKVGGKGDNTVHTYLDYNPSNISYYQLNIISTNGIVQKSNIVKVYRNSKSNILLFPNPAKDIITIAQLPSSLLQSQATVYDYTGKVVRNINIDTESSIIIDVSSLPIGLYTIRFEDGTTLRWSKF